MPEDLAHLIDLFTDSLLLAQQGLLGQALSTLDALLELEPAFLPALAKRAELLAQQARFSEALTSLPAALPDETLGELKAAIREMGEAHCAARLALDPTDPAARRERAKLRLADGDFPAALLDFDAAQLAAPADFEMLLLRSNALVGLDRLIEAEQDLLAALQRQPGDPLASFNLGNVRQFQLRHGEAIADYEAVLERVPACAEAELEIAHCLLAQGRSAEAWPRFEARWATAQLRAARLASASPQWRGEKLSGSLLVWTEQGFGDAIQFARFLPRAADRAGALILRAPKALHPLLAKFGGRIALIDDEEALPPFVAHCPLMSLPLALGLGDELGSAPYLAAAPDRTEAWRQKLGPKTKLRVGLAWAGRQSGVINRTRDIPLAALTPLLDQDCEFVCLLKEIPEADRAALAERTGLVSFAGELADFGETAALIANLDLVIAADCVVAHLAGAQGLPCWVMIRRSGEWRWPVGSERTPWYPRMRVFRQSEAGDWAGLARTVANELAQALRST